MLKNQCRQTGGADCRTKGRLADKADHARQGRPSPRSAGRSSYDSGFHPVDGRTRSGQNITMEAREIETPQRSDWSSTGVNTSPLQNRSCSLNKGDMIPPLPGPTGGILQRGSKSGLQQGKWEYFSRACDWSVELKAVLPVIAVKAAIVNVRALDRISGATGSLLIIWISKNEVNRTVCCNNLADSASGLL